MNARKIALGILLAVALAVSACDVARIVATLDTVVSALGAVVPVIQILGSTHAIDSKVADSVAQYVTAASQAAAYAAGEMQTSDSVALQRAKIGTYFAGIVIPVLPDNVDPALKAKLAATQKAIQDYLDKLGVPKQGLTAARKVAGQAASPEPPGPADKPNAKLGDIRSRAEVVKGQAAALHW